LAANNVPVSVSFPLIPNLSSRQEALIQSHGQAIGVAYHASQKVSRVVIEEDKTLHTSISELTRGALHDIKSAMTSFGLINPKNSVVNKHWNNETFANKLALARMYNKAIGLHNAIDIFHNKLKEEATTAEEKAKKQDELEKLLAVIKAKIPMFRLQKSRLMGIVHNIQNPKIKKYIFKALEMGNEAERLIKMVFTRQIGMSMDVVNLRQLLSRIEERFNDFVTSEGKSVKLNVYIDDNVPGVTISTYLDIIDVTFWNMLINSFKYIGKDNPAPQIDIYVFMDWQAGQLVACIKDNGIGIPKNKLSSVFKPGDRIERDAIKGIDGTGFGLSSVEERILMQAGWIHVFSEGIEGKGTVFTFGIPVNASLKITGAEKSPKPILWVLSGNKAAGKRTLAHALASTDMLNLRYIHQIFAKRMWVYTLTQMLYVDCKNRKQVLNDLDTFFSERVDYSDEPLKLFGRDTTVPDQHGVSDRERIKEAFRHIKEGAEAEGNNLRRRLLRIYAECDGVNAKSLDFYLDLIEQMYGDGEYNGVVLIRNIPLTAEAVAQAEARGIVVIQTHLDLSKEEQAKRLKTSVDDLESYDELAIWNKLEFDTPVQRIDTTHKEQEIVFAEASAYIKQRIMLVSSPINQVVVGGLVTTYSSTQNSPNLDVSLVKKALKAHQVPLGKIKDKNLTAFLEFLREKSLDNIVVFGGAVRDIFFHLPINDLDITVRIPFGKDAQQNYQNAMGEIKKLCEAMGAEFGLFTGASGRIIPRIPDFGNIDVQYGGPFRTSNSFINGFVIGSDSPESMSSGKGPSLLQLAIGCNGRLYGRLGALNDLLAGMIRITGEVNYFSIGIILRLLRLKYQFGLRILDNDHALIKRRIAEYTNGERSILENAEIVRKQYNKVINTSFDPGAAKREIEYLGIGALLDRISQNHAENLSSPLVDGKVFVFGGPDGVLLPYSRYHTTVLEESPAKEAFIELLRRGNKVVIVSNQRWGDEPDLNELGIKSRFIDYIPDELRRNITLYLSSGTLKITFDVIGKAVTNHRFNTANLMKQEFIDLLRVKIDAIVDEYWDRYEASPDDLRAQYPAFAFKRPQLVEHKMNEHNYGLTLMYLPSRQAGLTTLSADVDDLRTQIMNKIREEVAKVNPYFWKPHTIREAGATSIDIRNRHTGKDHALYNYMVNNRLKGEDVIFFGNLNYYSEDLPLLYVEGVKRLINHEEIPEHKAMLWSKEQIAEGFSFAGEGVGSIAGWLESFIRQGLSIKGLIGEIEEYRSNPQGYAPALRAALSRLDAVMVSPEWDTSRSRRLDMLYKIYKDYGLAYTNQLAWATLYQRAFISKGELIEAFKHIEILFNEAKSVEEFFVAVDNFMHGYRGKIDAYELYSGIDPRIARNLSFFKEEVYKKKENLNKDLILAIGNRPDISTARILSGYFQDGYIYRHKESGIEQYRDRAPPVVAYVGGGGKATTTFLRKLVEKGIAAVAALVSPSDDGGSSWNIMYATFKTFGFFFIPPGDAAGVMIFSGADDAKVFSLFDIEGLKEVPEELTTAGKRITSDKIVPVWKKRIIDVRKAFERRIKEEDMAKLKEDGRKKFEKLPAKPEDFLAFAAGLLTLGDLIDRELVDTKIIEIKGMSTANLLILGAAYDQGGLTHGKLPTEESMRLDNLERFLGVTQQRTLPVSYDYEHSCLMATREDGSQVLFQTMITDLMHRSFLKDLRFVHRVGAMGDYKAYKTEAEMRKHYRELRPEEYPRVNSEVIKAIKETTGVIMMGNGSLFTSLLPNLINPDVSRAILEKRKQGFPVAFIVKIKADLETSCVVKIVKEAGVHKLMIEAILPLRQQLKIVRSHIERVLGLEEGSLKLSDIISHIIMPDEEFSNSDPDVRAINEVIIKDERAEELRVAIEKGEAQVSKQVKGYQQITQEDRDYIRGQGVEIIGVNKNKKEIIEIEQKAPMYSNDKLFEITQSLRADLKDRGASPIHTIFSQKQQGKILAQVIRAGAAGKISLSELELQTGILARGEEYVGDIVGGKQEIIYLDSGVLKIELSTGEEIELNQGEIATVFVNYIALAEIPSIVTRMIQGTGLTAVRNAKEKINIRESGSNYVPEVIESAEGLVSAMVLRGNFTPEVYNVITTPSYPFGIGVKAPAANETIRNPHLHTPVNSPKPEVLIIREGKARFVVYDENLEKTKEITLNAGDKIVSVSGHDVIFLKNSVMLEASVGPWPGPGKDRIPFEDRSVWKMDNSVVYVLDARRRMMGLQRDNNIIQLENIIISEDLRPEHKKDWVVLTEAVAARNQLGLSDNTYIRKKYQANLDWCPQDQGRRDLHMHTSLSDGRLDIEDAVRELVKNVVKIAAITDHLSVCGIEKYIEVGREYGVIIIPACEFYCYKGIDPQAKIGVTGDIVAYFIDPHNQKLVNLIEENARLFQLTLYSHAMHLLDYLDKKGELDIALGEFTRYRGLSAAEIIKLMLFEQNKHYLAVYRRNGLEEMTRRVEAGLSLIQDEDLENFVGLLRKIYQANTQVVLRNEEKELLSRLVLFQTSETSTTTAPFWKDTLQQYISRIDDPRKPKIFNWGWVNIQNSHARFIIEDADELIKAIHDAGGVAIFAHPRWYHEIVLPRGGWYGDGTAIIIDHIRKLKSLGIDGVEVYTHWMDKEKDGYYLRLAEELDLLVTSGTDCHFKGKETLALGSDNTFYMPYSAILALQERAGKIKRFNDVSSPLVVLCVCNYNYNRSPAMEMVFDYLIKSNGLKGKVAVTSGAAKEENKDGWGGKNEALKEAFRAQFGQEPIDIASKKLTQEQVKDAGLIVVAEEKIKGRLEERFGEEIRGKLVIVLKHVISELGVQDLGNALSKEANILFKTRRAIEDSIFVQEIKSRVSSPVWGNYGYEIFNKQGYAVSRLLDLKHNTFFDVVPDRGATITSFNVNGREILHCPDITKSGGIPVMWPYANRIRDSKFAFQGKLIDLRNVAGTKDDGKGNVYHGMVRYEKWFVEIAGFDENGAFIRLSLDTKDYPAIEKHFGKSKITLTYTLKANQLTLQTEIINRDVKDIIMSLGFHPWFNTPNKANWQIELPANSYWPSVNQLPAGRPLIAAGTEFDLKELQPVEERTFDDAFTGLDFIENHAATYLINPEGNIVIEVSQDQAYQHVILYIPHDKDAICIEPQTSSTDAFNLYPGIEEATPVIVSPDKALVFNFSIKVNTSSPLFTFPMDMQHVQQIEHLLVSVKNRGILTGEEGRKYGGIGGADLHTRNRIATLILNPAFSRERFVFGGPDRLFGETRVNYAGVKAFIEDRAVDLVFLEVLPFGDPLQKFMFAPDELLRALWLNQVLYTNGMGIYSLAAERPYQGVTRDEIAKRQLFSIIYIFKASEAQKQIKEIGELIPEIFNLVYMVGEVDLKGTIAEDRIEYIVVPEYLTGLVKKVGFKAEILEARVITKDGSFPVPEYEAPLKELTSLNDAHLLAHVMRFPTPAEASSSSAIEDKRLAIEAVWNYIKGDIEAQDPDVAAKSIPFLSRLYHALDRTFQGIAKQINEGKINPFVQLNTLKYSEQPHDKYTEKLDRPLRIGFLPIAANPYNRGHELIAFMCINVLSLDVLVYRVQGEIRYKSLPESDRVPVKDRHEIMGEVVKRLQPLIRKTDLGSEPNNEREGFEELYRFLKLNTQHRIQAYYLLGVENRERVIKYAKQHYEISSKYAPYPNHTINVGWIQRGEYGARINMSELAGIYNEIGIQRGLGEDIPVGLALVKDPDIDLNVSSTYYRNSHDPAIVPYIIHEHAKAHGYYGHPPIDPRTNKPYDYNEEEHFKIKLRPVAEGIANQIVRRLERMGEGATLVVGLDGPSGSGKTTLVEEVIKYLEKRDYAGLNIGLDILLKEKMWRVALEKIILGIPVSKNEIALLGEEAARAKLEDGLYYGEEVFFDNERTLEALKELREFIYSENNDIYALTVDNGYNRFTKSNNRFTFGLLKGMVILLDTKYAFREEFAPYYHIRYRLVDNPDRTKAKFEIRTRKLSPNTADQQLLFYGIGLVPSFERYAKRTEHSVDCIIDIANEDWKLIPNSDWLIKFANGEKASSPIFQFAVSHFEDKCEVSDKLKELNRVYQVYLSEDRDEEGRQVVMQAICKDPSLKKAMECFIRAQDRENDDYGLQVADDFKEHYKERSLNKSIEMIKDRDIFILQMEYEFSMEFLHEYCKELIKRHGYSRREAILATGELAKLMMSGGLGSFKPDLVNGWYEVYKNHFGPAAARNRIHVMGVFYDDAIKGQGPIKRELVDILLGSLILVATYRNIPLNMCGVGSVDVQIFRNPCSRLNEYWIRCLPIRDDNWPGGFRPGVFHEGYPGNTDDPFRAVQTKLYRIATLQFIKNLIRNNRISHKLLFSTSEVNTTLAIPRVIKDNFYNDIVFSDILVHHYNHTIVPAGLPKYHHELYEPLEISDEFKFTIQGGYIDLVKLTGSVSDFITGCSTEHTRICREIIYKEFAHKIVECGLFGNSEGSYIPRWQGEEVKSVIAKYTKSLSLLNFGDYSRFFGDLFQDELTRNLFINSLLHEVKIKDNGEDEEIIDSLKLRSAVMNFITGCATEQAERLRGDLYGEFENEADVRRRLKEEIDLAVAKHIKYLGLISENSYHFFVNLNAHEQVKQAFIKELLEAQKIQKQRFIDALIDGIFGEIGDAAREFLQRENILDRPFFTFVRRFVEYKCPNLIIDILCDSAFRQQIIDSNAVIFIGGRRFDDWYYCQLRRVMDLDPEMQRHIVFITNHNVYTSWLIQQGTDFGGMLSWSGQEAGPTSFGNAQINGKPTFATLDGVIPERLKPIARDASGRIIKGTGYIVSYLAPVAWAPYAKPDKASIVEQLVQSSKDYLNKQDYGALSFNALQMGMTQGDIRNQAKGLIRVWAKEVVKKEKKIAAWRHMFDLFTKGLAEEERILILLGREIILEEDKVVEAPRTDITPYYFRCTGWLTEEGERRKYILGSAGLKDFMIVANQIIKDFQWSAEEIKHYISYIEGIIKGKKHAKTIIRLLENIEHSKLTPYEKHVEFMNCLSKLVISLENHGGPSQASSPLDSKEIIDKPKIIAAWGIGMEPEVTNWDIDRSKIIVGQRIYGYGNVMFDREITKQEFEALLKEGYLIIDAWSKGKKKLYYDEIEVTDMYLDADLNRLWYKGQELPDDLRANIFRISIPMHPSEIGEFEFSVYFNVYPDNPEARKWTTPAPGKNERVKVILLAGTEEELLERLERCMDEFIDTQRESKKFQCLCFLTCSNYYFTNGNVLKRLMDYILDANDKERKQLAIDLRNIRFEAAALFLPLLLNDKKECVRKKAESTRAILIKKHLVTSLPHHFRNPAQVMGGFPRRISRHLNSIAEIFNERLDNELLKGSFEYGNIVRQRLLVNTADTVDKLDDIEPGLSVRNEEMKHVLNLIAGARTIEMIRVIANDPGIVLQGNLGVQESLRVLNLIEGAKEINDLAAIKINEQDMREGTKDYLEMLISEKIARRLTRFVSRIEEIINMGETKDLYARESEKVLASVTARMHEISGSFISGIDILEGKIAAIPSLKVAINGT
ncbi:MAG: ATP-binding protein, partial [Candidatus Omnitrophica bacterium]|nr:ATP-binding protein [Candidatus Omnitrophota bacterium]